MIPFNQPLKVGLEDKYIKECLDNNYLQSDGFYTKKVNQWFENRLNSEVLLTTSCTTALEMSALLLDIQEGDEVIMPSYTFVSTANAFVLRGAKIVFVDIKKDDMNIDESKIEKAITSKTKAIVVVHYGGYGCEMNKILDLAKKHSIFVIEDAAQAMMASYDGKALGTFGDLGCYSFHYTKNYTSAGEGGLLIINNPKFIKKAEIIREKGTNRQQFIKGEVDKYSWVDIGISGLMSEMSVAFLYAQLQKAKEVNDDRIKSWNLYYKNLLKLEKDGFLELPKYKDNRNHNGHLFFIKVDKNIRYDLMQYLKQFEIYSTFHYVPLHSSIAGKKFGKFVGEDIFTTKESERLIRLPLFYGLTEENILFIVEKIESFFKENR